MMKFSPGFPQITETIQKNEAFIKGLLLERQVPPSDDQASAGGVPAATEQDHISFPFHLLQSQGVY